MRDIEAILPACQRCVPSLQQETDEQRCGGYRISIGRKNPLEYSYDFGYISISD
jgi:hypothetical protein